MMEKSKSLTIAVRQCLSRMDSVQNTVAQLAVITGIDEDKIRKLSNGLEVELKDEESTMIAELQEKLMKTKSIFQLK